MRIGVAATPEVAFPTLEWLLSSDHELVLVVTRPDQPSGRGRILQESAVAAWASRNGIPCIKPLNSLDMADDLANLDLVITIGYGVILPEQILALPRYGFLNLHFSLLPQWRGAAPVNRAILNRDTVSGISVFALDKGMDTGPLYVQKEIQISSHENAGELLSSMAILGASAVEQAIEMIRQGISPTVQKLAGVSRAEKISKEETRISWNENAEYIDRHIRAFTPEPGAWTTWRGEVVRITSAHVFTLPIIAPQGSIIVDSGLVLVSCGNESALVLEMLTPSGKKSMSAKSWLNGARLEIGEVFE